MSDIDKKVILCQSQPIQIELWNLAFSSLGIQVLEIPLKEQIIQQAINKAPSDLLLLDMTTGAFNPYLFCRKTIQDFPDLPIILTDYKETEIYEAKTRWALSQGAKDIIPSLSYSPQKLISILKRVLVVLGCNSYLTPTTINDLVTKLKIIEHNNKQDREQKKKINTGNKSIFINFIPESLCREMIRSGGLEIKDRYWRLRLYKKCFIGSEAVTWIAGRFRVSRAEAVVIGKICLRKGCFYHVFKEHDFKDDYFFYRFSEHGCPSKKLFS